MHLDWFLLLFDPYFTADIFDTCINIVLYEVEKYGREFSRSNIVCANKYQSNE